MTELTAIDMVSFVYKRLGLVSTNISTLLGEFVGINAKDWVNFNVISLTTQTVILELGGVKFNDFDIDAV